MYHFLKFVFFLGERNIERSAFGYFCTSSLILVVSVISYIVLERTVSSIPLKFSYNICFKYETLSAVI